MTTVALLEDEADLREEIADFLAARGHRVLQAGTLAEFTPLAAQARIAVLDVMLPDGSGLDALRQLRARSGRTGIIVLTALGALGDRVAGLNGGADHYLVKPFKLLELEAMIEALLRRVGREWVFEPRRGVLIGPDDQALELTDLEKVFVGLFARAGGRPVSRRQIVEALNQDWASYDLRRLDTLVSRLRARWHRRTGGELPLRTVHREGYGFGEVLEEG
jgi:two-component system OmpR family response regulator